MKILSNFDTQFREKFLARQKKRFSEEQILVLYRSRYHLYFRVILPGVFLYFLGMMILFIVFQIGEKSWYIAVPFILAWFLLFWFRVIHKLFKYLYDFTIITPVSVFTYKQKGILYSVMKEIPTDRIRSIQVERSTLLENVFQYGSINIHTDYSENMHIGEDDESAFVIGLTYVDDPLKVKNAISDICFH